ncbi:UDP-N-acetylmuramoyl-tripeptide--D-alanyl-D-alanine ligase [Cyanobium sp. FGCU-6]|nr:UDP-N-acetylmuramoyl-tripeptide--D-alanyl-D-alanine ligase [Cyanobium sp. FGCU6]
MVLPLEQLLALWGEPLGPVPTGPLEAVATDSRADLSGALFVPLVGERYDGHRFLESALRQGGAAAALAQRDRLPDAEARALAQACRRPIWQVDDTLEAYQQLGRLWRRSLAVPVVAVTGSAGKTTTRELIRAALAPLGPVVASRGNENNDIGAPLTLLRAAPGTAALVVEMGMRGSGEIDRLSRCAEPDVAVITNIGTAHIGRLGSREAIAAAKCEITVSLAPGGLLVVPAGDPLLEAALAAGWSGRVQRVALADELPSFPVELPPADRVAAFDAVANAITLQDRLDEDGSPLVLSLPLPGRHNARNLLLALAVAEELGVEATALCGLAVEVPGGRNRRLCLGGVEVLDETYNASPEAMLAALDLLVAPAQGSATGGRRVAVLGTMLELGERSLELHRAVGARAAALGLDGLVVVADGPEGRAMAEAARAGVKRLEQVATPEEAAPVLRSWLAAGDRLLLKASRGVALERVLPLLDPAEAGGERG